MGILFGLALCGLYLLLYHLRKAKGETDDSKAYLALGRGEVAEGPFGRRWLPPLLCKDKLWRWKALSWGSTMVAAATIGYLWGWKGVVLYLGCSSLARIPMVIPILVDAPAFALALLATILPFPLNLFCILVAGMCKESAPVMAAAWTLNPLYLLGLLGVRWLHPRVVSEKVVYNTPAWQLPSYFIPFHPWFSWHAMLFPWGALALLVPVGLGLGAPWEAAILSLLCSYGSLLFAVDRARLYQWALPALIPVALTCPDWLIFPLLIPHVMNPSKEV